MFYLYDKNKLIYRKIRSWWVFMLTVSVILLFSMSRKRNCSSISYENAPVVIGIQSRDDPFSIREFKQYVIDCGIRFPDVVMAQAVQESGFKSNIWMENNNPFGMKVARSRNTTAIGVNRNHAKYKNWQMAVIDYAYFQAVYAHKIKTKEQYFEYLKHYAEDENYCSKLKEILRKHKGFGISDDYLYY